MLKKLFILLILFLFPSISYAQNQQALCRFLPAEVERSQATIGADYVQGVDVNGKPVTPANLSGGGGFVPPMPDVVRIPLSVDLAKSLNQPVPLGTQMEAGLGMIEIYGDGRVVYNDQDLTQAVNTLCRPAPPVAKAKMPDKSMETMPPLKKDASAPPVALDKKAPLGQKEQSAMAPAPEAAEEKTFSGAGY